MVALALMVSCMPSAYTISASEAFGDGTEDIFTDGEITSEPAAEESTPDVSSADQEKTEQAQQSTLTYENDSVKVTAEALEDGALPQNTALKADSVNENSSVSYDTVSQKLSAAATDKGSSLRGFFAYDVYFADGDGNRVEPNGRVRVTFEYKTPAAPELTDAASTSVTVEKLHYNSSTGDTDVNTLQANEDLKVLNVNEGKQIQTLQVETGNAAVFAVMWDSPETADVEAETVSGNEDEVPIASEELTDGMDISDEPEQDAAETPAAENPEVTPEAEPSEEPAENPDAEPTEAPAEDPDVVEEPAEDIASPEDVPAADENGETSLIEVLGDDTNLRVSPSVEAEVLATVNAGTQLTLLDTVTAEDGATWYKVSWEGTEAYIRSDMAQVVESSDEAEEVEDVLESEEVSYSKTIGDVVVKATAASGVLPEDAQFVVNPIEKGSGQYADVADRLEKKAENEDYSIAGFLAYDIYFQDSEGNKINPEEGKVKVSMEYQNATAPEEVKEADVATMSMDSADENSQDDTNAAEQNLSVSVMHFVEDEDGNVAEVVNMSNEGLAEVNTTENGEIKKAEFETDSFSIFSVVWQSADEFISTQANRNFSKLENTADSSSVGIKVNLFDYETSINSNHTLQFSNGAGQAGKYNNWTGHDTRKGGLGDGNKAYQNIMQNQLSIASDGNKYPQLSVGSQESTSYLFSPTEKANGKVKTYTDVNKLFTKDSAGYYEYNSETNFASYNQNSNEFDVYNVPGSCSSAVGTDAGKRGGFFPFNTLTEKLLSGTDKKTINEISGSANYYFGMTMESNFLQPEDGKVNGNPMKFEFSGDDDVWVYVDGVLVLDIGGIHNAISGTIDFATGEVQVGNQTNTTLKELFKNAGVSTSDFKGNTFADYTGHTINFYYLERGAGASNCHLKFNLTTMPEGTVAVEKQLSNTDKEKYANVEFKFQLLAQKVISTDKITGKETYSNEYKPIGSNAVLNDGKNVTFSKENGYKYVFKLKPGQCATFSGLKKDRKYKVQEIGVNSDEYDHIYVNNVEVTDINGNITSGEATVASRPFVRFTNSCSAANSRELRITKQIKNNIKVTDTFDFRVLLNNQEYTGNYYLMDSQDSNGNYYTIGSDGKLENHGKKSTVCGTAENGVISSIPAGYTVVITQILSGTKFKVEEVNLNKKETAYGDPEYKVEYKEGDKVEEKTVAEDATAVEDIIELKKNVFVTVTNIPASSAEIVINKVDIKGKAIEGAKFTLTSDESDENANEQYKETVTSNKDGVVKFEGLSAGTYYLKETAAPNDYYLRNNTWTVEVDNKGNAKLLTSTGKPVKDNKIVNYRKEEAISANKTAKVNDWNKRTYDITITASSKVSESEESDPVDVVLVFDASGSMQFRSSLEKYNGGVATTYGNLDKSKVYYTIANNNAATVYRVWYQDNRWYSCDDSYWDYSAGVLRDGKKVTEKKNSAKDIFYITKNPNSRLYYLKDAAKQFAANLAGLSEESNIALVTFTKYANDGGVKYNFPMSTIGTNLKAFNSAVDNIATEGGTQPSLGINKAKEILTTDEIKNDGRDKYVILLTDGCPADDTHENVQYTAEQLKESTGCTLITIGVGLSLVDNQYLKAARDTLNIIASSSGGETGTKLAYNVDDASQLQSYFKQILQAIENKVTLADVAVKDYIDPRFELIESSVSGGGTIGHDDNRTYVIWDKQNVGPEVGDAPGWKQTITVRAKDEYIGGNNVTTNGSGSNVGGVPLPQPTVNVKSDLVVNNNETTIFYGDTVPTEEAILKALFDKTKPQGYVTQLDGTKKVVTYTMGADGQQIKPEDFTLTWYENEACTKVVEEDMAKVVPKPDSKQYYLKVTYNKLNNNLDKVTSEDDCTKNTDGKISGNYDGNADGSGILTAHNSEEDTTIEYGVYTIHIITGKIQITKNVTKDSKDNRTFTFNVIEKDKTGKEILKRDISVEVKGGETRGTVTLNNLKRGTYTVTEQDSEGYYIKKFDILSETDCEHSKTEDTKSATFILGNEKDQKNVDVIEKPKYTYTSGGVKGSVSYTNELVTNLDLKKVDSENSNTKLTGAKFNLEVLEVKEDDNNTSIWKPVSDAYNPFEVNDTVELNNLKDGLYKLTEVTAPNGYSLLSSSIYFKVELGKIELVDEEGNSLTSPSKMWILDKDNKVLTISNAKLYSLPNSGGPGTYGFTISGVAILATALLLFINNKRREEEAKRS